MSLLFDPTGREEREVLVDGVRTQAMTVVEGRAR